MSSMHARVHRSALLGRASAGTLALLLIAGLVPAPAMAAVGPAFTTQPGGAVYNQPFSPEARVAIMDGGTVSPSASGSVTVSIVSGTGTPGATLTCTGIGYQGRTFVLVGGTATATQCAIDRAGTGYRLAATWSLGGTATSAPFSVLVGPPSRLGFAVQPGGAVRDLAFLTQPVVEVQDAAGQRITTSAAVVTLSIESGTGTVGSLLACTGGDTAIAVAGVASFSGCSIDRAGPGFALDAFSPGLESATSVLFGVADPTPVRVGFTVDPATGTPSSPLAVQPRVAIQDLNGVTIPTAAPRTVTITLAGVPGVGTLTCAGGPSRVTVGGVAAFSGCAVDRIAVGYTLIVSSPGLLATSSAPFDVADRLAFTMLPANATAGEAFPNEPIVAIRAGPSALAGHDDGTPITLSIKAATGATGAVLSCDGGLTHRPVGGVATFPDCTIDRPGPGYVLVATSAHLAATVSSPFSVAPGVLTVIPSLTSIVWGHTVFLAATFHPRDASGAGRPISLLGSRDGQTWFAITTQVTDSAGTARFGYRPATNLYYRAVFAGDASLAGANSPRTRVAVRQIATLRAVSGGSTGIVRRGGSVTFAVTIRPSRLDLPTPVARFEFYHLVGSSWVRVATRRIAADAAGVARTTWPFVSTGRWYVRALADPTPYNANSVWTPILAYDVI